jgi:uncharacterized lipoprotein YddW (UPF0748 family)
LLDVTRRYDVDGIHLDDYFYPYPVKNSAGEDIPFDDDDTWMEYLRTGGNLSRSDWRRAAVDRFVARLYRETKAIKPWVRVGISPFGIWRPQHPPGIEGLDQYEAIYADAKKWLNEGWVDYFAPQLYWPIEQEKQSFPKLLNWWVGENTHARHVWPGDIPSRLASGAKNWSTDEIRNQILTTRQTNGASGNIHFSMRVLMTPGGPAAKGIETVYDQFALTPASPWLDATPPEAPQVQYSPTTGAIECRSSGEPIRFFLAHFQVGEVWRTQCFGVDREGIGRASVGQATRAVVSALDYVGNEGPRVTLEWP